jgi:molecular chaperone GrpE
VSDANLDPLDEELAAMVAGDASDASPATAEPVEEVDPFVTELADLVAERDQFKDIALRLQADFENYRKRAANQQADEVDRMTGRLVDGLLPVLDACEAAFAHGATEVEPIWSALLGALAKQGLEVMDLAEKPFDPKDADAVMHEEGDGSEPVVSEVLRTGYRWKGRVLRAAMVKVKG